MTSSASLPMASVALVRTGASGGSARLGQAELRLEAVMAELDALDAEVEASTHALEVFAAVYEEVLADAYAEVDGWETCLRRLRALQDELVRLTRLLEAGPPPAPARRRKASTRAARGAEDPGAEETAEADACDAEVDSHDTAADDEETPDADAPEQVQVAEEESLLLKRLHRRLARVLHPDLAQTDAERERLGGLMAQVNHAYQTEDRTLLELMAARLGAGEGLEGVTEEDRIAHLEQRTRTLSTAAQSLRQQRERLRATATGRLYEEAQRRAVEGRDYLAETRAELDEEASAMTTDMRARMTQLERAARALTHARSRAISALNPTDKKKLRVFDPVLESALVRKGVVRLERQRATDRARTLARELEEAVASEPWNVWLTLMAYFAEAAGRPPPGLANAAAWAERYEALRATCPEAPSYEKALARLPRHLELGLRVQKQEVRFGLQLRETELLAAVPLALQRESVAEQGRLVLGGVGPREACRGCGAEVYLVHLLRTRGLDELNGMVCPDCGKVAKSYWMYAKSDGQEALLPHALRLGLVAEVVVRFAGVSVGLQLLPTERQTLTVAGVRQRLVDLYLTPYGVELAAEHLLLMRGGKPLAPTTQVGTLLLTLQLAPEAGQSDADVLALLRSRIERRFRPDPTPSPSPTGRGPG